MMVTYVDRSFATSICDKLAEMIESLKTPVETKLKLIPIFQYMHRDLDTIRKVRQLSERLLPSYPAQGFVSVTLHTLSQLSARSLIDIPLQASDGVGEKERVTPQGYGVGF